MKNGTMAQFTVFRCALASVALSVHPSIHPSICLSVRLSVRLSVHPSIRPLVHQSETRFYSEKHQKWLIGSQNGKKTPPQILHLYNHLSHLLNFICLVVRRFVRLSVRLCAAVSSGNPELDSKKRNGKLKCRKTIS